MVYFRYGFHISSNSYYICHDPSTIKQMFEEIRNYKDKGQVQSLELYHETGLTPIYYCQIILQCIRLIIITYLFACTVFML